MPETERDTAFGQSYYRYGKFYFDEGDYQKSITYFRRSTVMTPNRPLEDRGNLVGDVSAATAILDRFLQHAEIIAITGRSYRLKGRTTKASPATKKTPQDKDTTCEQKGQ